MRKPIEIENAIELPNRERYPFNELKVGQGFKIKGRKRESSIRAQASKHNNNGQGKQFIVRLVDTKGWKGVGVKRTQ